MKNVYIVRFEGQECFTTARKAIEHAKEFYGDWETFYKSELVKLNTFTTEQLITRLNKGDTILIENERVNYGEITKCVVN